MVCFYSCEKFEYSCYHDKDLRNHEDTYHPSFSCSKCEEKFVTFGELQDHEDLKHNKNLSDMLLKFYSYFVHWMADGVETRDSIGQHELPLMVSTQNENFEASILIALESSVGKLNIQTMMNRQPISENFKLLFFNYAYYYTTSRCRSSCNFVRWLTTDIQISFLGTA